jgi:putative transposase
MRFQRKTFSCYTSLRVVEECGMREDRHNAHSVTRLSAHIVWVTKYRYHVLEGEIKVRCRDLLVQICDAEDVRILKGVVSKDHVHMHIEYPPSKAISDLVKRFKGRTSRMLQLEYPHLKSRYWGKHFWVVGYGAWSTGNVTEALVQEYLEHHRHPSNRDTDPFILA